MLTAEPAPATLVAAHRARVAPAPTLERGVRELGLFRRFAFVAPPIDVREFVGGFSRRVGLGPGVTKALRRRIEERFDIDLDRLYAPDLARDMDAPLLLVHDRGDKEVPLGCSEQLAAAWPGARLEVTEGLGHNRILRDAGVIERIVDHLAA